MWRLGVLCWLALASSMHAHASFLVGLSYEYVGSVDSLHTYRIYAEFNNAFMGTRSLRGPWRSTGTSIRR